MHGHSVYRPWLQGGLVIFRNLPLGGGLGNFWSAGGGATPLGGGLQNLGGAEDFDNFCKNVIQKFSKIK